MKYPIALLAAGLLHANAALACDYPEPPKSIPDGGSAARGTMLAKMKEMDRYRRDVEQFVICEGNSQKARNVQAEAERVASRFNAEVRAFKAANDG